MRHDEVAFLLEDTHVTGRRVAAHFVDLFVIGIPLLVAEELADAIGHWIVYVVALVLLYLAYFGVFQALTGRTWGKLLASIRLVDASGNSPSIGAAMKRTLTLIVEIVGVLGLISALRDPWRQRWGDRWAGTYVTRRFG